MGTFTSFQDIILVSFFWKKIHEKSLFCRRQRTFRVVIKLAARVDLHHLDMFLSGRQADAPQEALQVLDIVLRELPTTR